MKTIDERLWDFIDGTCSAGEKVEMEKLLQQDDAVKQLYEEFLFLSVNLKQLEPDEPSMRFTQNVMDQIAFEPAPRPLTTTIDKRIINTIAGFFIATLSAIVIYALSQMSWTAGDNRFKFNLPQIDLSKYFGSTFIEGAMIAVVIAGLFVFDRSIHYFRQSRATHSS